MSETEDGPGPVAVVTGAGRGIGRAIALALAGEGWRVAALSRTAAEIESLAVEITASGGEAVALRADVNDESEVNTAVEAVLARWGAIDLLVNNAGTHNGVGLPWEVEPEVWWGDIRTSMLGPFLCVRAVAPGMVERGSGRIINLSSGAASEPRPYSSGYAAAKTAAQRWTESVAGPLKECGVLVFSLNPGPVLTPMNERNLANETYRRWYPEAPQMQFRPIEDSVERLLLLASGAGDALAGRYVSVFDDLTALAVDERLADPEFLTLRIKR